MRRLFIPAFVSIIALSGCMDDRTSQTPAAPAAPTTSAAPAAVVVPTSYQSGGGAFAAFYAEEVHDNRLHVFGTKSVWEKFQKTKEMDPLNSRRLIGKGPNKMTLIVETTKDEPAKDKRILKTVAQRYNLSL